MSFEISGRITDIFPTQQVTDTFKKREFILEIKESSSTGFEFVEYIKFQTLQDKCTLLDNLNVNDSVRVSFNLKGRKWEKDGQTTYFTNLDAWKIENERSTDSNPTAIPSDQSLDLAPDSPPFPDDPPPADDHGNDDLPF